MSSNQLTAHYADSDKVMRTHILDVSLFPHPRDSVSIQIAMKNVNYINI